MYGLDGLLSRALQRHGINRQVTAAVVVARANAILAELAMGPLREDVCVVVYKNDELVLACAHSAASYDVQHLFPHLRTQLEAAFPQHTFARIVTRIAPVERYDGQWSAPQQV